MKRLLMVIMIAAASPDIVLACEMCFGAGSDAPAIRAVTASMSVLFVTMGFVFFGIIRFFGKMNARAAELAEHAEIKLS